MQWAVPVRGLVVDVEITFSVDLSLQIQNGLIILDAKTRQIFYLINGAHLLLKLIVRERGSLL